jgi:DNA-binding YbaB/EbfC family protein
MKDLMKLMQQAGQIQQRMQQLQEDLAAMEIDGQSGGGLVQVKLNGKGEMRSIRIDPSLLKPDEAEIVEDLILAAHQDARAKVESTMQERMQEVTAAYRPAILVHQGLNLVTSVALVIACILLVRWSARGPGLFIGAAIASLLVDLAGGGVQVVMQLSMNAIMQDYLSSLAAGDPNLAGA